MEKINTITNEELENFAQISQDTQPCRMSFNLGGILINVPTKKECTWGRTSSFQRGITLCHSEATHQIIMAF